MSDSTPSAPSRPDEPVVPEEYRRLHGYLLACREALSACITAWLQEKPMDDMARIQQRKLQRVETALDRFRRGVFGVCEQCGKEIPPARMNGFLFVTSCLPCRRKAGGEPPLPG